MLDNITLFTYTIRSTDILKELIMVGKKQIKNRNNKVTPKKILSPLSTEDRLRAFANIIIERILEDKRQGILRYRVNPKRISYE